MVRIQGGPRLIGLFCAAEILTLAGFASFAALIPELRASWGLSNTAAGWIEGAHQAGYLIGVLCLLGYTDRWPARRIYMISTLVSAVGLAGFGLLAHGLWSAAFFRFLAGVGLAGTFMPGLKILTDLTEGKTQSRAIAFYTACFSLGGSLSLLLAGATADALGWRWAFLLPGLCALVAYPIVARAAPGTVQPSRARAFDLGPVLRNRMAIGFSLAYIGHMWELYGFRAWLVAFLVFAEPSLGSPTVVAALILTLALPASLLGNEAALRFGRRRTLIAIMSLSAIGAAMIGFVAQLPWPFVAAALGAYCLLVSADSAALTAGAVAAADPGYRGATMAMHMLFGYLGATLGPLAFGAVLDLAGEREPVAWGLAFAALGAGVACGPLVLWRFVAWRQPPLRMTKT